MDKCLWVTAGYPVMALAIAALWRAYQKSQKALLKEQEDTNKVWKHMKKVLRDKARGRGRGGSP